MILDALWYLLIGIAVLNLYVSWKVLRDEATSPKQRAGQVAVVWLVPLLGALLTLYLKSDQQEKASRKYREVPDAGDDFGDAGGAQRHVIDKSEGHPQSGDATPDD